MTDLVAQARAFATEAHERIDQRRKYTHQPYQEHLKAVAGLVAEVTTDSEMLAAAWLHDTVEDTPATFGDIEYAFGTAVRELVAELTDVSRPADGNRAERKAIDRLHLARASPRGKTIKLADLIDNCRDICAHDPRFARVYLPEAASLLEVLEDGDPVLYRRAQKAVAECARRLGLREPPQSVSDDLPRHTDADLSFNQRHGLGLFTSAFTAREIAQPLRSFDAERPAANLLRQVRALDLEVAGLRRGGVCVGYLRAPRRPGPGAETDPAEALRQFESAQVLRGDAPLADVVRVLTRYDFCFVTAMGDVAGVITRGDMQSPIVRMWLFGIITLIELELTERIRSRWSAGGWTQLLTESRLKKAETLLAERRRRGQHVDLADCLQLSDKGRIVMEDPEQRAAFGLPTKGAAKRVMTDLESLRNNLAHAQDIVTHDWPQIARLAERVEELSSRHGRGGLGY
jgi:hypothetical protein